MSDFDSLARSAADGNKEDFYTLLTEVIKPQFDLLNAATGNNMLAPTNSPQQPSSPPPPPATPSVTAANGVFTVSIGFPTLSLSAQIWAEVSYSSVKGFSSNVTTLPPSTAATVQIPAPGQTMFFRVRLSYDRNNWNSYVLAQTTAAAAGLQSSSATADAAVLNQTNYAIVDSIDAGNGTADVRVFGPAGPGFAYPAVKGSTETIRPAATRVGVPFSSTQVVAYGDGQYAIAPTLPQVLADGLTPVGAVSVVGSGAVVLPQITPIEVSGGILGYNVENQGNGLTADLIITIVGSGTGATAGQQTIVNGKLISVGPGNTGSGYGGGTTCTVSGGTGTGIAGGGQQSGGNGGRLVYNDATTG